MFLKRYKVYRLILQTLFGVNCFLIFFGLVAAIKFYRTGEVSAQTVMLVGLAVLVFGIVLPTYFLARIETARRAWEVRIQKIIAQFLASWADTEEVYGPEEKFRDPSFWISFGLMTLESLEWKFKNPVMQFIMEMSPMIRESLHDQKRSAKKKNSRGHKVND